MKVAFTGHRPNKIGGYDKNNPLRKKIQEVISQYLVSLKATFVITGGALGVDTDAAREAYKLGIPYSVITPCRNHSSKWPEESQRAYKTMCELAHEHRVIDVEYSPQAMQNRNIMMVDECDILIAVWDGSQGGTSNCVNYARQIGKKIIRINPKDL